VKLKRSLIVCTAINISHLERMSVGVHACTQKRFKQWHFLCYIRNVKLGARIWDSQSLFENLFEKNLFLEI